MSQTHDIKQKAFQEIDSHRQEIFDLAASIWEEPEEGYKEYKTAAKVAAAFRDMEIPCEEGLAVTGVKGRLTGCSNGSDPFPTVAVLGELDALINPNHPEAAPGSGAVHACGHHAQIASLIAAGWGIRSVMEVLAGDVVLFAVPAEEGINFEYRNRLRKGGTIKYFAGKQELVRMGAFDDIDIALMHHQYTGSGEKYAFIQSSNAILCKQIRYIGKAAHAGVAPEQGVNAIHAYHVALAAINALRETFRDEDAVRVHGIITRGGSSVNIVPDEVAVEMYIRAKTTDCLRDINSKIDRALRAGGIGVGADVEITGFPGYLPLQNDKNLQTIWKHNTELVLGRGHVGDGGHFAGGTDMGDLSQILPCIHPLLSGGCSGSLHGTDFMVTDDETAYITAAKITAALVIDLLSDGAAEARHVIDNFQPALSTERYKEMMDSYFTYNYYRTE